MKELYDELERTCMDRIEPTPGGPVFAVIVGVYCGQWHKVCWRVDWCCWSARMGSGRR